jgi:hypothetical protein
MPRRQSCVIAASPRSSRPASRNPGLPATSSTAGWRCAGTAPTSTMGSSTLACCLVCWRCSFSAALQERCDHAAVVARSPATSAGMVGTANRDGPDPRRRPRRRRGARCMLSQQPHVGPGSAAGRGWLRAAGCRRPWLAACCWPAAPNSRRRRVPSRPPPALARRWAAQQRRPRRSAAATPGATTPASAVRQAARRPPRYGGPCASHLHRSGVAVPGRPRHGGPSGGSCC